MFVGCNDSITRFLSRPSHTKRNRGCKKTVPSHLCGFTPFSVLNFQFSIFRSPQSRTQRTEKPYVKSLGHLSIVVELLAIPYVQTLFSL